MIFNIRSKGFISAYIKALLAVSVFAIGTGLAAQTPTPTPTPSPSPSVSDPVPSLPVIDFPTRPLPGVERIGVTTNDQLPLTLERAIEMALANNNDIEISRKESRIAEFSVRSFQGVYDPLFNSQSFYESRTTPTASTIGGAVDGAVTQKQFYNDLGITGFVPRFGGSYDVIFNSARTNTTNRNATLNPQYPASLIATLTQPLWRNRSIDNNRRQIEIARKNVEITDAQLQSRAIAVVSGVEQAYWDLVFALRFLQLQNENLRQAREQFESNRRLVESGVLAPIELVAANAQIANFEQAIFAAQEGITRAENSLKTIILPDRSSAEWLRPLTPVSSVDLSIPRISLEVAIAEALKNRPELDQLATAAEINRIDQKFYKNQTKPQIDLVGTYTAAGLAGTPNPLSAGGANVPEILRGGYFTSLGNLFQQDFPTYRAGVQIGIPFRNTTAKANLGRSLVEGDQILNSLSQTEQIIEAEVRNALQSLRSAESRLASAVAGRAAAEELYASEQRQFRSGTTTFYLVLQRQTDLSQARSLELQAQTSLNKAISEFHRAIGTTLTVNNVTATK